MGLLRWLLNLLSHPAPIPRPAPEPQPDPAPTPEPAPSPAPAPLGVVEALNAERARYGLPPLADDARLARTAAAWAEQMAADDVLTHGDFPARIAAAFPDTAAAEDIAEGAAGVADAVALWMNSRPHRANILGDFTIAGAGRASSGGGTVYWCVDFAAP